jgi:hypothetical protein
MCMNKTVQAKPMTLRHDEAEVLAKVPSINDTYLLKVRCNGWTADKGAHMVYGTISAEKKVYEATEKGKKVKFTIYRKPDFTFTLIAIYAL